jgi:hypothetical protein
LSHRRRLHGITLLIALVAAALLVPAVPASAAPPTGLSYNLKNDQRNLACLAGRSNGKVQTSQCVDAFTDQYWLLEPASAAGFYMLQNRISGLCLGMTTGNHHAIMSTCGAAYVWWALEPTSLGDSFMLRHYVSQKCLVALHENGDATDFPCTFDFHDQWWHFVQR